MRGLISAAKAYNELLVDYVNYRGLEVELFELRNKCEMLAKSPKGRKPTRRTLKPES